VPWSDLAGPEIHDASAASCARPDPMTRETKIEPACPDVVTDALELR
jgi:hypothetical protein